LRKIKSWAWKKYRWLLVNQKINNGI